ncbi:MAG: manganese catalase family protein [Clostridia bacterium]|nr:manganese catalase family protein [Clostridia bacterium]
MVAAIIHQLTRNLSEDDIKKSGFDVYFVDHTTGVYPVSAAGVPFDIKYIGVKGDVIADLNEDLAAEQKARVTYDNLLRLIDDPDVCDPIKFLREREVVHYQRFGEANRTKLSGFSAENGNTCDIIAGIFLVDDFTFLTDVQILRYTEAFGPMFLKSYSYGQKISAKSSGKIIPARLIDGKPKSTGTSRKCPVLFIWFRFIQFQPICIAAMANGSRVSVTFPPTPA